MSGRLKIRLIRLHGGSIEIHSSSNEKFRIASFSVQQTHFEAFEGIWGQLSEWLFLLFALAERQYFSSNILVSCKSFSAVINGDDQWSKWPPKTSAFLAGRRDNAIKARGALFII